MVPAHPSSLVDEPLVSIVTPTLDQARFIEHTILSIKAQTYRHIEHIVIDGGSTDETHQILRAHEGSYSLRWLSEPDRGMYDAINKGMRLARGEILAYLNSDDLYFPWTIDRVVRAFRANPFAGLVYGDGLRLNEAMGTLSPWFQPPFRLEDMRSVGSLLQPSVFWRRRLLDTVGEFDASLRYVGDVDYWLRAGTVDQLVRIGEILAIDRVHPDALSVLARAAMQAEDQSMRSRYHRSSKVRQTLASLRAFLWRRARWLSFVMAIRHPTEAGGWSNLVHQSGAEVSTRAAVLGLLPLVGNRYRGAVRWQIDPVLLANGEVIANQTLDRRRDRQERR
ncbi:MAG: glycosyltransferase family 2 protein [Thermoanaerobaculia bacterium]